MRERDAAGSPVTESFGGSLGRRRFPVWVLPCFVVALGINAVLFLLLPLLSHSRVSPEIGSEPVGVNLVRLPEPEPPVEEEELPRPPEDPPEPVLSGAFEPELFTPRLRNLDMPALNLKIDARPLGAPSDLGLRLFYNAEDLDQPPLALAKVPPLYPFRAKRMDIEGYVKVRFLVDEEGQVSRITVLESEPQGVFDAAVLHALPSWKFQPGRIMGEPVSSWVVTTIRFELG